MLSLWQMSLSASAVILLTALLRRMAANRLPRRMYVALWDIALLAGIIPFRVPWEAFSRLAQRLKEAVVPVDGAVFSAPSQAQPLTQIADSLVTERVTAAIPVASPLTPGSGIRESLTQAVQPLRESVRSAPDWLWQALGLVWLSGAILLAAVLLYRWASCLRVFSEALPCEDRRVTAFLREHRLLRPIRVRASGRVSSPLSYGLLRPAILLPTGMAEADDQTLSYVLTHEFMHIRAWDMLRKWALLLVLCLHWFNPCVWLMLRLCNRDIELMCDERVVRRLGGRKAYCLTLLDMEVQRSNLTMGTCFSVTGIEERIQVMKNRKHQGILSFILAIAILIGTAAGAMTGMPLAGAESDSPRIFITRETWDTTYAKYEKYGLGYDEKNGTITYNGQVVRYFEDMWPIDEQGKAGTCFLYEGGTVDVYGVREFPEYIQRNPDGSFDPSGILVGLREGTREEYNERMAQQQVSFLTTGFVTEGTGDNIVYAPNPAKIATVEPLDVVWWTADEYREWMEAERIALQELVEEQERAWTPSTGWFTWTQEKADEAMARYESILRDIESGACVSKTINGEDANMVIMQNPDAFSFVSDSSDTVWSRVTIPLEDSAADDAVVEEQVNVVFSSLTSDAILYGEEKDLGSDGEMNVILVSVKPGDERLYTPEAWAMIQALVEKGLVQWTDPATTDQNQETCMESYDASQYEASRIIAMREAIAPYAPFGLSYALDPAADLIHLYWNGQEVRGVFDPERGVWVTDHAGNSHFPDGAKELIAVYEHGELIGLREADTEENAAWDALRNRSMQR